MTILAVPAVIVAAVGGPAWLYAAAVVLLAAGYALQFIGHGLEGNDAGEIILIKKVLGLPYTAVARKSEQSRKEVTHE